MTNQGKQELIAKIGSLQIFPALKDVLLTLASEIKVSGITMPDPAASNTENTQEGLRIDKADDYMLPGMFKDDADNA